MRESRSRQVLVECAIALAAALFVLPVLLIYITSLKPDAEIVKFESLLPKHPTIGLRENFKYVLTTPEEIPIFRWLFNSILISTCATLLVLTVDSLAAYALARLRPRGGRIVF